MQIIPMRIMVKERHLRMDFLNNNNKKANNIGQLVDHTLQVSLEVIMEMTVVILMMVMLIMIRRRSATSTNARSATMLAIIMADTMLTKTGHILVMKHTRLVVMKTTMKVRFLIQPLMERVVIQMWRNSTTRAIVCGRGNRVFLPKTEFSLRTMRLVMKVKWSKTKKFLVFIRGSLCKFN